MKRRLLNLLTLLSLLLCVAAAVSWPVSFVGSGRGFDEPPPHAACVEQAHGRLRFVIPVGRLDVDVRELFARGGGGSIRSGETVDIRSADGQARRLRDVEILEFRRGGTVRAASMEEWSAAKRQAGCEWRTGRQSLGPLNTDVKPTTTFSRRAAVTVPHGYVVIAAGALPAWRAVKAFRRRRRNRGGLCPRCGYDLRATPGRCPECGFAPAGPKA